MKHLILACLSVIFPCQASDCINYGVDLAWVAPTTNEDGSPLTDLAGYSVYVGSDPAALVKIATINPATSYRLTSEQPGTRYFALATNDTSGNESVLSNIASIDLGPVNYTTVSTNYIPLSIWRPLEIDPNQGFALQYTPLGVKCGQYHSAYEPAIQGVEYRIVKFNGKFGYAPCSGGI